MASNNVVAAQGFVGQSVEQHAMIEEKGASSEATPAQDRNEDFFQMAIQAISTNRTHLANGVRTRWISSHRAYMNQHFEGSKYMHKRFRGRSHFFRPKTRSAVRAIMATAANALFATPNVVTISAGDDQDPKQRASAAIKQELVNYRLDRSNNRSALPWFVISMGAAQSAAITGLCASKQYWEYRYREVKRTRKVVKSADDGTQFYEDEEVKDKEIVRDRPMIKVYPMEQVLRDPAASWEDQVDGSSLVLCNPMTVDDLRSFMALPGTIKWRELGDQELSRAVLDYEASAVRRSREEGQDRLDDKARPVKGHQLTWVYEVFLKHEGEDYCFWMLGNEQMISEPVMVSEAYPWNHGDRPVVIGLGALDAFTVNPMSPVESWQPMQSEMNDLVNLRLDNLKQNISPLAKVKRGRSVNIEALQNRAADTVLLLEDPSDVEFDRPPTFDTAAYAEMDRLNADFDDLAGKFSGSSVSTNRSMNETVGGMRLLNQSAMSLSEFDLRVWIETWVEPVLRQVVKLEEWFETDETVLALAANNAKMYQRYGISDVSDDLLERDVTVRVNVGIGSADPMQALAKFGSALEMFIKSTGERGLSKLNMDEIADEIFGKAGYRDSDRFVRKDEEEDPRIAEMQKMIQQLQQELQSRQMDNETKIRVAEINARADLEEQRMESDTDVTLARFKAQQEQVKQVNDARRSVTEMFISGEQQKQVAKRKEGDGGQIKPAAAPKAAPAAAPQPDMNQGLQALAAAVMQMAQANQEAMREIAASIQQRP